MFLAGSRRQRRFERAEDDLLVHALLVGDRVDDQQNLLAACLSLGFDLPYFCWHPAMGSVGACRQCAVKQYKDDQDRQGRLVMACLTPADNARISIADPDAHAFRASVIRRAYELAGADKDFAATDDCGVVLRYLPEVPIWVVPGDERKETFKRGLLQKCQRANRTRRRRMRSASAHKRASSSGVRTAANGEPMMSA